LRFAPKTSNKTSLGTVPKAETTLARFVFFANVSAPDAVCAIARVVSLAFIGIEQVIRPSRSGPDELTRLLAVQGTDREELAVGTRWEVA